MTAHRHYWRETWGGSCRRGEYEYPESECGEDHRAIRAEGAADERERLREAVRLLADRELASDAEKVLHCIWPTIHLRVLDLLEQGDAK